MPDIWKAKKKKKSSFIKVIFVRYVKWQPKKRIAPPYPQKFHILFHFEHKCICVYLISSQFYIVCEKRHNDANVGEGENEFKNTMERRKKVIPGKEKKKEFHMRRKEVHERILR